MALEKGLPAVPRGQSREMTAYLQSLHNVIASVAGFGRNSDENRAARVSEVRQIARSTGREPGSVVSTMLGPGSVTETKLATGAVSAKKLATDAVQTRHISAQAVTGEKIADAAITGEKIAANAVTLDKIADGAIDHDKLDKKLLPVILAGSAKHGETVTLGKFEQAPLVAMTYQNVPIASCGELVCGIFNLREEAGAWRFDVKAAFEMGIEDGISVYPGEIGWTAIGFGAQE